MNIWVGGLEEVEVVEEVEKEDEEEVKKEQ